MTDNRWNKYKLDFAIIRNLNSSKEINALKKIKPKYRKMMSNQLSNIAFYTFLNF